MTVSDDIRRAMAIFDEVCDLSPPQRESALDSQCGGDAALRQRVERMLAAENDQRGLFADSDQGAGARIISDELSQSPDAADLPERIERYRIIRELGRGGMGVVFEAEQDNPRRRVALKLIQYAFASAELARRFRQESHVLGRLHHPGIAQVIEAGATRIGNADLPYFTMELINGAPLDEYARSIKPRRRLELMARVCDAVHHAHQRGVIHRDLKPTNILVTEAGQPKILDFGVSRATNADMHTVTLRTDLGQLVGTIRYMSPEQVTGDPDEIDTRSDVYSLGVVLYQVLTGRLPHDLKDRPIPDAVRIIREEEHTRLSSVDRQWRGDIDTIVGKALEKDKDRRYQSAAEMAADIRRYLADEPLFARPPSALYQFRKFARRNRALVTGTIIAFAALIVGFIALAYGLVEARKQRDDANFARAAAEAAEEAAEKRRNEAETARAELQVVVDFQSSMLSDIDVERMGAQTIADLRERIRASFSDDAEANERLEAFDRCVGPVNSTDLAKETLDRQILARAGRVIEQEFADQPLIEADLRATIATAYADLGLLPQAEQQYDRAVDLRRQHRGDDDPETLELIFQLSNVCRQTGNYARAERLANEALDARRRVLGDDHPDTLQSIGALGGLYYDMGKHAEAASHRRAEVEGLARVVGKDDPRTLKAMENLSLLLLNLGNLDEAEHYLLDALEIQRRSRREQNPDMLVSATRLGELLASRGQYAEAEPYFRDAVEGYHRRLGSEHATTLDAVNNLGVLLARMGRLAEAEPLQRNVLDTRRRVFGPNHMHTLMMAKNMANLYFQMGNIPEAEKNLRDVVEGSRRSLGEDHPQTLHSTRQLANLLKRTGRPQLAEPLYRDLLARHRRADPGNHAEVGRCLEQLGVCLIAQQKHAEAEPVLREYRDLLRENPPEDAWRAADALGLLGAAVAGQGRYAEAEPLLLDSYDQLQHDRQQIPVKLREAVTGELLEHIVRLYENWDKPEKAANWRARLRRPMNE